MDTMAASRPIEPYSIGDGMKVNSEVINRTTKYWIASKIFSSVQTYFAHWDNIPNFDLDREYRVYLGKLENVDARDDFILLTQEFVASLRNGHTTFEDRQQILGAGALGFFASWVDKHWVVVESNVEGLNVGDVITSLDGVSMETFYQDAKKFIPSSSDSSQRLSLYYRPYLFPQSFRLGLSDGRSVNIDREVMSPHAQGPIVSWKDLGDGVGYLRVRSFQEQRFQQEAIRLIEKQNSLRGLIVDVRGNSGGVSPETLIEALIDRPYDDWATSTSMSVGLFGAYGQMSRIAMPNQVNDRVRGTLDAFSSLEHMQLVMRGPRIYPSKPLFSGPLIILIDRRCGSAGEDFVMPFKVTKRATLVGEPTWGSSGQPYIYKFDENMTLMVGSKRMLFPDGSSFEGRGIEPDIYSTESISEIRDGIDKALSVGVAHLRSILAVPAPQ